jgi:hypothetical protein
MDNSVEPINCCTMKISSSINATNLCYPAENNLAVGLSVTLDEQSWSVVAEWLGHRTLNQRVVGSNPGVVSVSRIP